MSDDRMNSEQNHHPYRPSEPYGTPEYPDPAAPAAYPGAVAPGNISEQYPGYTGPSPYPPAPITPSSGPGGLAISALVVGIAAFVLGWIPVLGLVLAIVGIVLGILALRGPRGRGFGIAAIVLSALAALTGLGITVAIFFWLPFAS